jgi:L-histidine Nalpha-methyltransferase
VLELNRQESFDPQTLAEVRAGFSRTPRVLSPRYFYDERGSHLFEEITALPEYYQTRTERALLEEWMPRWIAELAPRAVVELGAGSAVKTRIILDAVLAVSPSAVYHPLDISADFLRSTAEQLREEYERLHVRPIVADIGSDLELPATLARPALFALLGSTIGNFEEDAAIELLGRTAASMREGDRFLLGFDLHKETSVLEAAYNDAAGVTAAFNLNILPVLNRQAGADFDPDRFRHRAFYDERLRRIEMHLVSTERQVVTLGDGSTWVLDEGESIRTEISCKYDRAGVERMMEMAGLGLAEWATDDEGRYAIALVGR